MKRTLYKSFALLLVAVFAITGFSGCTKEYITEETIIQGPEVINLYREVGYNNNPWHWNEVNERYECFFQIEELTREIYDDGVMIGNVFVEPGLDSEWLELLPYSTVYLHENKETGEIETYTVNVSCSFIPGEVGFYLQLSDRTRNDDILEPMQFKVSLVW